MRSSNYRLHLGKLRRINNLKRRGAKLGLTEDEQRRLYEQALAADTPITKLPAAEYDPEQSTLSRFHKSR